MRLGLGPSPLPRPRSRPSHVRRGSTSLKAARAGGSLSGSRARFVSNAFAAPFFFAFCAALLHSLVRGTSAFRALLLAIAFPGCLLATLPALAYDNVLRVLAWPGYADSDVVKTFESRYNAHVEVTFVDSDEALWSKLHTGAAPQFDVLAANTAEIHATRRRTCSRHSISRACRIRSVNCRVFARSRPSMGSRRTARRTVFRSPIRRWDSSTIASRCR